MYVYYSAKPKLNFANDYIFKMSNISVGVGRRLLHVFKSDPKLYFDLGLKTFCLFDFPLNTLFKCKGTTGPVSWAASPHTAFASGVFKLRLCRFSCSSFLTCMEGMVSCLLEWLPRFPLHCSQSCLERSLHRNCKCYFPCLMSDLWAHSLRQRFALCNASILHHQHSAGCTHLSAIYSVRVVMK